jgi:hypothetical protein
LRRYGYLLLGSPRKRKLSSASTKTLGDLAQLPDLLQLRLAFFAVELLGLVTEEVLVRGETRVLWDAFVILSCEDAGCKRAPDCGSVLELLIQGCVFALEPLAVEGIVLWLLCNRGNEVVLFGDLVGLLDLRCRPLRSSPLMTVSLPFTDSLLK